MSWAKFPPMENVAMNPIEAELPKSQKYWIIALSCAILASTIELVKRRKVREEESWLWLGTGAAIFLFGTQYRLLVAISRFLGIVQPASTIFFFGQVFFLFSAMRASIQQTLYSLQIKNLAQEIAIIKNRLEDRE